MNDLQTVAAQLPDTLEDLAKFALIGREKLTAVRAEIRAIQKVGLAKEVHEQKLKEAQEIAEAVLDAEVKLGELTAAMPKASADRGNQYTGGKSTSVSNSQKPKAEALKEAGIPLHTAERFERMAKHPEAVEAAKAEARQNGEIATRSAVMEKIKPPKKPEDVVRERVEQREQEIQNANVVNFQTLQQQKKDKEYLSNVDDYDIWKEFRSICRTLERFAGKDEEKLRKAFQSTGIWGSHEKNEWRDESLDFYLERFTKATNTIKAIMMEVLTDD